MTQMTGLDHDQLLQAARLMESEGGSFAYHIARAFYVADRDNSRRLLASFAHLFEAFYQKACDRQAQQG